jgi:hypothetical protein
LDWNTGPWGGPSSASVFANPRANEYALPGALALGVVLHPLGLWIVSQFFYHELGHAFAAWLCGRWAVPIPIAGLTLLSLERSWFFTALTFGGLGWIWKWSWSAENNKGLLLSTLGLMISSYLLLGASGNENVGWIVYGGCAGEIVISTLVIVAFYWEGPERLRWDFWRWPVLLSGAVLLVHSLIFWSAAQRAPDQTMMGENLTTSRDGDQDWVKLVRGHGWTSQGIADNYFHLALGGLGVVAIQYLWCLGAARGKEPREESDQ